MRILVRMLLVALSLGAVAQDSAWTPARPDYAWSFPRDHYAHPAYKTEWWYYTGHLADTRDTAQRFGYQFTFFRIGVNPRPADSGSDWAAQMLIMGHAAITDVRTGRHYFSDVLYRTIPLLGGFGAPDDSLIAWSRGPAGTEQRWTLARRRDGFAVAMADRRRGFSFDLEASPTRALVFEGPNGFSRKGPGPTSASQYYSFTRLQTGGTLRLGDRVFSVRGTSWMDQEIGSNQLAREQVGWDWFALQLDDGRDLMLYLLRDSTGATSWASGTLVPRIGAPRYLAAADYTIRPSGTWTSDSTGARYPARWTVSLPADNLTLEVVPLAADQENRSAVPRGLFYWEGAVEVRAEGRAVGKGYVELTGYGKGIRPAL